jgi:hypothetical protein
MEKLREEVKDAKGVVAELQKQAQAVERQV